MLGAIPESLEPALDVYELDHREPCVRIDQHGTPWLQPIDFDPDQIVGPILERPRLPKVLFAGVPVMIHTAYGFSLAPIWLANDKTGPELPRPQTPSPMTRQT